MAFLGILKEKRKNKKIEKIQAGAKEIGLLVGGKNEIFNIKYFNDFFHWMFEAY